MIENLLVQNIFRTVMIILGLLAIDASGKTFVWHRVLKDEMYSSNWKLEDDQ